MSDREKHIEFEMNYCQHYDPQPGKVSLGCKAGCDIDKVKRVATKPDGIKWGPCIGGHTLENPTAICPHWIRRTREMGEKRADAMEKAMRKVTVVMPVVNAWRKKEPFGKEEVIECPECKGRLHLSQSSYNGHVRGRCETADCLNWIE